jgi:hypothetical protein
VEGDLAAQGGAAQLVAYAHPAFMLATLALALLTLRAGLALRRARRLGLQRDGRTLAKHLRLAKLAITLLPIGYAAGLASALWLRGWDALASAHGRIASVTLALFLTAAYAGRKLERKQAGALATPDTHALLAVLAALGAAASLFTGFVLLP